MRGFIENLNSIIREKEMVNLEKMDLIGRKIRKDDWCTLAVPTWMEIEEAIMEKRWDEAIELVDYLYEGEGQTWHNLSNDFWAGLLTYVGSNFGEHEVERMWRDVFASAVFGASALTRSPSAEERVYAAAEIWRAHYANKGELKIWEEEERYVLSLEPCPTGGRHRKEGKLKAPYNLGKTSRPYPWSWNRKDIPWYCTHCAIVQAGSMPIEAFGYPIRVQKYPDNPEDPSCLIMYYKRPELIPEEYFEIFGHKKDTSKFKTLK